MWGMEMEMGNEMWGMKWEWGNEMGMGNTIGIKTGYINQFFCVAPLHNKIDYFSESILLVILRLARYSSQ